MAAAAEQGDPHGMLSVVGLPDDKLAKLCSDEVAKQGESTVCQLANYLFPQGRVVSGHKVGRLCHTWWRTVTQRPGHLSDTVAPMLLNRKRLRR